VCKKVCKRGCARGYRVQEKAYRKGVQKIMRFLRLFYICFNNVTENSVYQSKKKLFEGRMLGVFERLWQIFGFHIVEPCISFYFIFVKLRMC
jgi:hypothetical protein